MSKTRQMGSVLRRIVLLAGFPTFALTASTTVAPSLAASEAASAAPSGVIMRRLTPDQYEHIITQTFGADVSSVARFSDQTRESGLIAISASRTTVTPPELEQFDGLARSIAEKVVDKDHRDLLIPCKPASLKDADDACARTFLTSVGRTLYRRPLTPAEADARVKAAGEATRTTQSFYDGLAYALAGMLVSPNFLFRIESIAGDNKGELDAYSKASRLSFFLWNTQPDEALLKAAEKGDLDTPKGITAQVDRMIASRRFETAIRAFFSDLMMFDEFNALSKDAMIYPRFTQQVTKDAQEQTMRTLIDLLLTKKGDYRDIFTTRTTFLTPALGSLYSMPVPKTTPNMEPADWIQVEYPENDPRSGILTQASFVALHSHPGRSSPTLRGKALREILLCQRVPDPPGNVNFTVVQDTNNPQYKTARERLNAHATEAMCTGCHKITDPMGLALDVFDGAGSYRAHENGAQIDTTGTLDGVAFKNAAELGQVLHKHPSAPKCLVTRLTSYALGRVPANDEKTWIESLQSGFAKEGYRVPDLFKHVATSPEFFKVAVAPK